ncbi:MAG: hypothetical protein Q8R28_18840 [Dehalococcoidia bacterium]|nr:hypothetical protein [Dehalococcoidia bacterium]
MSMGRDEGMRILSLLCLDGGHQHLEPLWGEKGRCTGKELLEGTFEMVNDELTLVSEKPLGRVCGCWCHDKKKRLERLL